MFNDQAPVRAQAGLFLSRDPVKSEKVIAVMDQLNARFGRSTALVTRGTFSATMQALTYLLIMGFHALLWNLPFPEKRILLCAAAGRQPAAAAGLNVWRCYGRRATRAA